MKDFVQLTNRGQALRLRRMALVALERYDLPLRRVRLVTNELNGIFRVDTTDGRTYALRVCAPEAGHSLPEIRSELMWLAALRRDTDLKVLQPIATRAGELVTTVEAPDVPQARHCVLFSWVPGPDLAERLTPANLFKLGVLAARLHDHAATFAPPDGFWRKTADSVFPFGDPIVLFDDTYRDLVPRERFEVFQRALARVDEAIQALYAAGDSPRVVHYDLHQWNVKVYRGRLYALDFEDMMWGHPVQDVAISLYHLQGHEDYPALRAAFQQGYSSQLPWPEAYPGQIEALKAGRALDLANFAIQDPNAHWQQKMPAFLTRAEKRLRAFLENC